MFHHLPPPASYAVPIFLDYTMKERLTHSILVCKYMLPSTHSAVAQ